MDFIDKLRDLATQIPKHVEHIRTEEATKTALVLPFIQQALGYDVHNPAEVTPEYIADVGVKKGEKVDYVILKDSQAIIMFECKSVNVDLDKITPTQLYRYFSVSSARFGVLTNGIVYRVFSDLQEPNKMDAAPFLEINMLGLEEPAVEEFKKFSKGLFDADAIIASASDFKYTREIRKILNQQLQSPTEDFVKFLANVVHPGRTSPTVKDQFTRCVKRAFSQFVNEQINTRIKAALVPETVAENPLNEPAVSASDMSTPVLTEDNRPDREIITTAEELEAYYIVKAILRQTIDPRRIVMRDALSYCAILFDDNNRKPICRLYFNTPKKAIGVFDGQKQENRISIGVIDDIYKHSEQLLAVIDAYVTQPTQ